MEQEGVITRFTKPTPIVKMYIETASYFTPWINFYYYILLVPFKISHTGKSYYLSENIVQKVLCGALHSLSCISAVLEIRGKLVGKVGKDALIFSQVADRAVTLFLSFIFYTMVWFNRSRVMELFKSCDPSYRVRKASIQVTCFCLCTLSVSIWALVTSDYFKPHLVEMEFFKSFENYAELARFEIGLTSKIQPISKEEFGVPLKIGTGILIFLRIHKWLMTDISASLTALVSFVALQYSKQFFELIMNNGNNEALIFEAFEEIKEMYRKLNNFIGGVCVMTFCSIVAYCDAQYIGILDSDTWSLALTRMYYCAVNSSGMILAAEANYKATYFRTWLVNRWKDIPRSVSQHPDPENYTMFLAIRGDRFFTITYNFIGTIFGLILTYSIMMIQFRSGNNQ